MSEENVQLVKVVSEDQALKRRRGYPKVTMYPEANAYGYEYGTEASKINVRAILRTLRKRKWLILLVAFIAGAITTIEVYRTQSMYQASATIEIRKDTTTIIKTADFVVQTDDIDTLNTYTYMLKSKPLLEDVAVSLKLDSNPSFLEVTQKKSLWDAVKTVSNRITKSNAPEAPPAANLTPVVTNKEDALRTPEERAHLSPYVGILAGYLNIEQVPLTRILTISYTHTDPSIAAAVANATAQAFIERNYQAITQKYSRASSWLDEVTRKLKGQVEEAEQKLANYTRENNLFQSDSKESIASSKYMRLHEQVMRAETERVLKQSLLEQVQEGRAAQLPESFTNTDIKELKKKLGELRVEAAQLDVKYGPDHYKVKEIRQQIAAMEQEVQQSNQSLESRIKADYERAVRDEASLKILLEQARTEAAQQNQAAIQYGILKQDVDTTKTLYTEFLQKTNQANLQLAEQESNLRLAEPADVPTAPIGPNRSRAILIALFLGLSAGIGLAFALDYFDNTIKTVEDVSRYAGLPALSVIPAISGASNSRFSLKGRGKSAKHKPLAQASASGQLPAATSLITDSRSTVAEAYRVLRTSVLLSAADHPPKSILITSAQPSEGKTTTAVNTAISLSQLGASVIIIDADLRRPSVHKLFGVEAKQGLSAYLSRDIELDPLIHKVDLEDLSFIPCGTIPPNPAELISSEKMKSLIRILGERYDHIIIDSPPLMNVTDPVILSTFVDGVILVVHSSKSTRQALQRTRNDLASVGAKIFGVVLNNVDFRHEGYNDYYYYRYYAEYNSPSE